MSSVQQDYSVYNSPFRSSIFAESNTQTVRQVYRHRIEKIYQTKFPCILKEKENADDDKKEEEKEEQEGRKKLNHALQLLDEEYFGREQDLYEFIYDKYVECMQANSVKREGEYLPGKYSTPLISEVLLTENGDSILCSECLQEYGHAEFPDDELQCNGYYLACSRCAPDRNNVVALKWHPQYKSDSVVFENNGYVAKVTANNHRYCLVNQRPVTKGIHCWRWCTKHYQSWFLWGISHCKKYTDNSYGSQGVFGIAGSNQSYKNGQCTYDIQTGVFFGGKNQVIMDMLLDLNTGELKWKVPGNETEAKMTGIPKDNAQGYVPHVNMHYANATVEIRKIPTSWYGKMSQRVKF
eukprot:CAMPEP_0197033630 /NCGR_PEP_ID=MMETSP1384-20130603/11992_1 /TAXON_ID=29189 /ORGANISM="Ammonia sp." /LENGTH=351 /DNA_ID=CAMNT_0042463469 /DNA_START=39 /DNA_END=1094 /DNA_ORIENTATION=-